MKKAVDILKDADAVLVGIGSGMSSSAGYNHYHNNPFFQKHFHTYQKRYGFDSLFGGFYYVYNNYEEQWGYYTKYIDQMYQAPAGQCYHNLKHILKDKPYFILTTNVDIQLPKVFPDEVCWHYQGDFRYFQCNQPCCDELFDSIPYMEEMKKTMHDLKVSSLHLPRCPYCHRVMVPWVQDDTFMYPKSWYAKQKTFEEFIKTYKNKKLVLLELGVGDMTPSIIKFPFWKLLQDNANIHMIQVNTGKSDLPEFLHKQNNFYQMDITDFTTKLKELL